MPSSNTITTFYSFTPGTTIRSSEVNNNFTQFRGHIIPVDPTAASSPTNTYDLGGDAHNWRAVHQQYSYYSQHSTVTSNPPSGYSAVYVKTDGIAYIRDSAGVESALGSGGVGGGALVVTGSRSSPSTITVAGLTYDTSGGSRQMWFITGDTTTGTDITANPQISVGSTVGQELILVARDGTRPVKFEDGNGLSLNGEWYGGEDSILGLFWDSSAWVEMFRRD